MYNITDDDDNYDNGDNEYLLAYFLFYEPKPFISDSIEQGQEPQPKPLSWRGDKVTETMSCYGF